MDLESYVEKLDRYADNQANSSTSTLEAALPTGKNLHDRLENLFYLEHEIKHLFPIKPTFFRYTEADETLRKLQWTRIPEDNGGENCWKFCKIYPYMKFFLFTLILLHPATSLNVL